MKKNLPVILSLHPSICFAPSTHTLPLSHSSTHLSIYLIHPSVSPFISLSVLNSSLLFGGTKVGKTAFWKAQEERPWGESEVSAFRQKPPEVRWSHKLNPRFTHTFLQPRTVGSLWAACSSTNSLLCSYSTLTITFTRQTLPHPFHRVKKLRFTDGLGNWPKVVQPQATDPDQQYQLGI